MRKLPSRKLLAAIVAGALFVPTSGFTLGLGEIEVNSALNQRLNADIELLSAEPEETENIIVKLASRKEFARAGLDRPYLLNDLRFKSVVVDGVAQIKVSSGRPIREPFVNFLIEIDWPNGHLLREYTILLDPPVFMTQSTNTVSVQSNDVSDFRPAANTSTVAAPTVSFAPRPVVQAAPVTKQQAPVASKAVGTPSSAPTFIPAPVVQQQTPSKQVAARYRVKSGDTAWKLADAMRPNQGVSVPQMLMALLKANPESFINENINGLKRGYILRAPDLAQIAAISQADAKTMMREHGALWRQYQLAKAGKSVSTMTVADKSAAPKGGVSGNTNAAVNDEDARLSIVAGGGTSTVAGKNPAEMSAQELRAELALAKERVETERVEKEALKQRLDVLEQHATKTDGLLTIEDEQLVGMQPLDSANDGSAVDVKDSTEMAEETALEKDVEDTTTAEQSAEAAADEIVTMVDESANQESNQDAIFTDEVKDQKAADKPIEDHRATMEEAAQSVAMRTLESEPKENVLTRFLNNPTLLAVAGGGLLLIMALMALIFKRRKDATEMSVAPITSSSNDLESLADDIAEVTAMDSVNEDNSDEIIDELAADEYFGAESADDATVAEEGSELAETIEEKQIQEQQAAEDEEEPRDDIIAEADVYLAYGIYQQAEDLLVQAISDHPENDNYRIKLAETHYTSKNADAFLVSAADIKQRVDNNSSTWAKIIRMGQDLCADDPMFLGEMPTEQASTEQVSTEQTSDETSDETSSAELIFDEENSLDDAATNVESENESPDLPDLDVEQDAAEAVDVLDDSAEEVEDDEATDIVDEIEFDLSDTGAFEEETIAEDEFSLDIDASELDIETDATATNEEVAEEEGFDLGDIDMSLDSEDTAESSTEVEQEDEEIDFNLDDAIEEIEAEVPEAEAPESEETVAEEQAEDIPLDMSDAVEESDDEEVSLDLSEEVEMEATDDDMTEAADAVTAANDDSSDGDFDFSSRDDDDEISTKLDLARAYLDMGDHDGTRDILNEVLADGNDEQKQEANELMEKLG